MATTKIISVDSPLSAIVGSEVEIKFTVANESDRGIGMVRFFNTKTNEMLKEVAYGDASGVPSQAGGFAHGETVPYSVKFTMPNENFTIKLDAGHLDETRQFVMDSSQGFEIKPQSVPIEQPPQAPPNQPQEPVITPKQPTKYKPLLYGLIAGFGLVYLMKKMR